MRTREYYSIGPNLPAPYRLINVMQVTEQFYMKEHSHPFYHVNYVLDGSLTVITEGKTHIVNCGCIFVLPPHIPHALTSEEGYLQIGTDILPTQSTDISTELIRLCPSFVSLQFSQSTSESENEAERMRHLIHSPLLTDSLRAVHLAEDRILRLLERLQCKAEDCFTEKFLEMLSQHEPWTLSLADMCRYLSVSRTQLERLSHRAFGCGASAYRDKLRYRRICDALQSNETLESIAAQFNFYDAAHLSRFFTAKAGITPGQYRKNLL